MKVRKIRETQSLLTYADIKAEGWSRSEHTTKGSDPTLMVQWSKPRLHVEMTEFQGVIAVYINGNQLDFDHPTYNFWVGLFGENEQIYYRSMVADQEVDRGWYR